MSAADFLSKIANTVILLHHNVYCKKNITKERMEEFFDRHTPSFLV